MSYTINIDFSVQKKIFIMWLQICQVERAMTQMISVSTMEEGKFDSLFLDGSSNEKSNSEVDSPKTNFPQMNTSSFSVEGDSVMYSKWGSEVLPLCKQIS